MDAKLLQLIEGISVCHLTTHSTEGGLRSRPMATLDSDGEALWFFTRAAGGKVSEIEENEAVNLAYASPEKNSYASVSGHAQLVNNPAKVKELWRPEHRAWFPKGIEDPELGLLKVTVEKAEIWDGPHGGEEGEHRKVKA